MAAPDDASAGPLAGDEVRLIDAWWRAANYLSVGQIYLLANALLHEPLGAEHIKPRLLGHWGTTPGLNLIWEHLNRLIRARDLEVLYITGPGHGGPGIVANAYLEGTYSELYAQVGRNEQGLGHLFRQFSFPGGIPSHAAPETPGSIHEGGDRSRGKYVSASLSPRVHVLTCPSLTTACTRNPSHLISYSQSGSLNGFDASVASIGSMYGGIFAVTAPVRSISAAAAGAWPFHRASRSRFCSQGSASASSPSRRSGGCRPPSGARRSSSPPRSATSGWASREARRAPATAPR